MCGERGLRGEGTRILEMVCRFGLIDERNHPLFALARQLVEQPAAAARSIQDFLLIRRLPEGAARGMRHEIVSQVP